MTRPPLPRRVRHAAAAATIVTVALVAAGCSDDSGGRDSGPSTAPPSSSSSPASGDPTTSDPAPSPTPASETPTGPAPATGPELRMKAASVRMPDGWELDANQARTLASGGEGNLRPGRMNLSQFPSLVQDPTPHELEQAAIDTYLDGRGRAVAPVVVDGVEMRHVTGTIDGTTVDRYTTVVDGDLVGLSVVLAEGLPKPERQAILDSVLASFTWR